MQKKYRIVYHMQPQQIQTSMLMFINKMDWLVKQYQQQKNYQYKDLQIILEWLSYKTKIIFKFTIKFMFTI